MLKKFNNLSPDTDDWSNTLVELYVDYKVRFGNETVAGIRISPEQPEVELPKLTPESTNWSKAVEFLKTSEKSYADAIQNVRKKYQLTYDNEDLLKKEAGVK